MSHRVPFAIAVTVLFAAACSITTTTNDGGSSGGTSGSSGTSGTSGGTSGASGTSGGTSGASGASGGTSGTSGSSGGTSGTSGASGGTSGSSGATDAGTDAAGGVVKKGTLTVSQTLQVIGGNDYYSGYAFASFYQYDPSKVGPGACTTTTTGACSVIACNLASTQDAGVVSYPNAGTVTFTTPAPTTFTLSPTGANGAYNVPTTQTQIWTAGDTVTASATGGDVPAFSGKTVTAPSDVTVTAPVFDTSARTTLSRASDLSVAWSGGSVGNVQIMVSTSQVGVHSVSATCTFAATAGSATIPAAVMGQLDKADGTSIYGSIVVAPQNDVPFKAGDWDVTLRAGAGGKSGLFTATD